MIERYGIYWVDPDPLRGHETSKKRPAVVVSDEEMNAILQTVVVCPLTTRLHPSWPSRIRTNATGRPAEIAVDQIRTVSRGRLQGQIGRASTTDAATLQHVITEMYGVLSVSSGHS